MSELSACPFCGSLTWLRDDKKMEMCQCGASWPLPVSQNAPVRSITKEIFKAAKAAEIKRSLEHHQKMVNDLNVELINLQHSDG